MRVAVRKLDGVESVEVSLTAGSATVRFKPGSRVTIDQVRATIRDNGFTPKAADVRIRGRVEAVDGNLVLVTPGGGPEYPLVDRPDSAGRLAPLKDSPPPGEVEIEGILAERAAAGGQLAIEVRSVASSR